MVLEVLGEIAERARGRDRLHHLGPPRALELGQFRRQCLALSRGHRFCAALDIAMVWPKLSRSKCETDADGAETGCERGEADRLDGAVPGEEERALERDEDDDQRRRPARHRPRPQGYGNEDEAEQEAADPHGLDGGDRRRLLDRLGDVHRAAGVGDCCEASSSSPSRRGRRGRRRAGRRPFGRAAPASAEERREPEGAENEQIAPPTEQVRGAQLPESLPAAMSSSAASESSGSGRAPAR